MKKKRTKTAQKTVQKRTQTVRYFFNDNIKMIFLVCTYKENLLITAKYLKKPRYYSKLFKEDTKKQFFFLLKKFRKKIT